MTRRFRTTVVSLADVRITVFDGPGAEFVVVLRGVKSHLKVRKTVKLKRKK